VVANVIQPERMSRAARTARKGRSTQPQRESDPALSNPPERDDERSGATAQRTPPLHEALLDAVLDPTVAIDDHGEIVLASASVERVFGWRPDELIGRNVRMLMPEPHHSAHDGYLANYRATGHTGILGRTRRFTVPHRDGHELEIELSVSRAEMPDGGRPLFIGSFRDVTERVLAERRLEDRERRLRSIFEGSFQFFGLLDIEGRVLEANRTALESAGLELADVVGRPFWETRWWSVSEESRAQLRDAIARAREGECVRFETVHRGSGDDVLIVDFSLKPLLDAEGRPALLIPEGRDITALKRAQRAETAMLRALASIGESAAMLAHEIKNPITAVNLALRAVARQLGTDDAAVLQDLVGRLQRLERTMRRTLSFARPLDIAPRRVRVAQLVDDVLSEVRPELERQGTRAECLVPDDLFLSADPQLMGELLTNLLRNAREALGNGGRVRVAAERRAGDRLRLTVDDDGPGIPPQIAKDLFRPFVTSRHAGTGLGLAFCRKVAEAHGGTIDVERSELGGARFTLSLPMA
jgi:PAS domain S-box-containing protein